MNGESNHSNEDVDRMREMDKVMEEYHRLLEMVIDQYKKDLQEIDVWFNGMLQGILEKIMEHKEPSMSGKQLAEEVAKRMEEAGNRATNTIEKVKIDTKKIK